jgi:hypothetical protein
MTAITSTQLGKPPFKYTGAVICLDSSFIDFPNNVGGGSIAQDPRLVLSDVFLPFNPVGANATTQFTQRNYFALAYNSTVTPPSWRSRTRFPSRRSAPVLPSSTPTRL